MPGNNRTRADLVLAAVAVCIVAILISVRQSATAPLSVPSTYDTGANGYAAVYELLAREGARVSRFERPLGELRQTTGTLVIAGDDQSALVAPSAERLQLLDRWVRAGNSLAILGTASPRVRADFRLPRTAAIRAGAASAACGLRGFRITVAAPFHAAYPAGCSKGASALLQAQGRAVFVAYRQGKGLLLLSATPALFDNANLSQADNARFAYAVFSAAPVAFEERAYGHASGRTFWQVLPLPMRVAIWIAIAGILLGIAGANLPFAPALRTDGAAEASSSGYLISLARMLERGRAGRTVMQRLCERAAAAIAPHAHDDARARELLSAIRSLEQTPSRREALAEAGRLFALVRKEYGCS